MWVPKWAKRLWEGWHHLDAARALFQFVREWWWIAWLVAKWGGGYLAIVVSLLLVWAGWLASSWLFVLLIAAILYTTLIPAAAGVRWLLGRNAETEDSKEGTGTTTIAEPVYVPEDHANEAPGQSPTQQLGATPASPRLASRELHFADTDIEYVFGEPGRGGYPESKTGAARMLRAEAYFICLSPMQVESVELDVQGKSIPSDWQSTSVYGGSATGRYIYLEIPPEVTPGPHEVKLLAFADGILWKSESSYIIFPQP